MKLLAIDADQANLAALSAAVRDALPAAVFLSAQDSLAGIELAAAEDPDLVVLDLVAPGLDGFEVCRKFKADERLQDIPVLFLTARKTGAASRSQALQAGAEAFLSRPLKAAELTAQVRSMAKIKAASRRQRTEKQRLEALAAERTQERLDTEKCLRAFLEISQAVAALFELNAVLQLTIELAVQALSLDSGAIYLLEGDELLLAATQPALPADFAGESRRTLLSDHPHIQQALSTRSPVAVRDAARAELAPREREAAHLRGWRSILYLPLVISENAIGTLVLASTHGKRNFSQEEISLVRGFAAQAAQTLENVRLYEASRRFAAELERENAVRRQAEVEVQRLNAALEQRVAERTRELLAVQEQLVLQDQLATLGQLAGGVAHELRNPLGNISAAAYYLKLIQPHADAKVQEYLGVIQSEIYNAQKIIADLLEFARPRLANLEAVAIEDLVRRTLERFPPPPSVEVVVEIPPRLPPALADPIQVGQALGNLLANAYQAMSAGGTATIRARQAALDGQPFIAVSVQDSGAGIPAEKIGRIFEPLFTVSGHGAGLGLAVCRLLVEANHGRIEVQSQVGQGSTFTFYLLAR